MGEYAYVYYASLPLPHRLLSLAIIHSVHTLKSVSAGGVAEGFSCQGKQKPGGFAEDFRARANKNIVHCVGFE
jgi:hypothetical protein